MMGWLEQNRFFKLNFTLTFLNLESLTRNFESYTPDFYLNEKNTITKRYP